MTAADIGLIGLAVMGENLVLNMESHGYTVAVYNRTQARVEEFVAGRAMKRSGAPIRNGLPGDSSWSRVLMRWICFIAGPTGWWNR